MNSKSILITLAITLLCLPLISPASSEVITLDDLTISVVTNPDNKDEYRILIKFDLPKIPEKANIDFVKLIVKVNLPTPNTEALFIKARRMSQDWDINSADWELTSKADDKFPSTHILAKEKGGETELRFDLTELVKGWYKGDILNQGFVLCSADYKQAKLSKEKIQFIQDKSSVNVKIYYTVIP